MLKRVIVLELRKHQKNVVSAVGVLFSGALISAFAAVQMGAWQLSEAMLGTSAFLALTFPVVAVIFGVQSGLGLRKEPERSHEETLPVHPSTRFAGAYLASLLYLIPVVLIVWILMRNSLASYPLFSIGKWIPLLFLNLHFLSFVFSYWSKLPIVSGGIALIISAFTTFPFLAILSASAVMSAPVSLIVWLFLILAAVPGITSVIAGFYLARRIERGEKLKYAASSMVFLGFLFGSVLTGFVLYLGSGGDLWNLYYEFYSRNFWIL